jgi:hypothetical protein
MANAEDIIDARDDPSLLVHFSDDRLVELLVVFDVASRYLPPATARLLTSTNQKRPTVANDDSSDADAEVPKENIVARRTGDAVAPTIVFRG